MQHSMINEAVGNSRRKFIALSRKDQSVGFKITGNGGKSGNVKGQQQEVVPVLLK